MERTPRPIHDNNNHEKKEVIRIKAEKRLEKALKEEAKLKKK